MLSEKAFEEAKDFFILAHRYTTFLLSSYLNYLDEWVSAFDDWVKYPPVPLHNLTMVKRTESYSELLNQIILKRLSVSQIQIC